MAKQAQGEAGFDPARLKRDLDFAGSFAQKMGKTEWICPGCGAHLTDRKGQLICLKGCHRQGQAGGQVKASKQVKVSKTAAQIPVTAGPSVPHLPVTAVPLPTSAARPLVLQGDCAMVLRGLAAESVDAVVTDPPAGISFMGRRWDHDRGGRVEWIAWLASVMRECLRALKPGGHALVWALPRTSHWTGTAIEDAGFETRDVLAHLFGTGFPKSLDVALAIDRSRGAKGSWKQVDHPGRPGARNRTTETVVDQLHYSPVMRHVYESASGEAQLWTGWGTALKPGAEFWILARKPLTGTVAANVLQHGTGAINVEAIETSLRV